MIDLNLPFWGKTYMFIGDGSTQEIAILVGIPLQNPCLMSSVKIGLYLGWDMI